MDKVIQQAKILNNNLPDKALRRNSIYYELVTYINNSIAFYISQQYDYSSLFIMRAYHTLNKRNDIFDKDNSYIQKSKEYLDFLIDYYINNNLITQEGKFYLNKIEGRKLR